jgi:hypothetical protein
MASLAGGNFVFDPREFTVTDAMKLSAASIKTQMDTVWRAAMRLEGRRLERQATDCAIALADRYGERGASSHPGLILLRRHNGLGPDAVVIEGTP